MGLFVNEVLIETEKFRGGKIKKGDARGKWGGDLLLFYGGLHVVNPSNLVSRRNAALVTR